jgi:hypothetical protein
MKRSVAALSAAIGVAVALVLILAVWVRVTSPPSTRLALSGQRTTRSYDFTGFTGIETSGQWQVTLVRGDAWAVELAYPIELEPFLDLRKDGDHLVVGYKATSGLWSDFGSDEKLAMNARIVMPALDEVDLNGATKLDLAGFQGPRLEISASGAVAIRGTDSRYDALDLTLSGAGRTDLGGVTTTDAHLDVSGAQTVSLRMGGGSLSGSASGVSNVDYFGTVASQDVATSGFANIEHRE